jgi:hypothetical protein
MHTSPRTLWITGRVKTTHSSFHRCTLLRAAQLSGFPHTRPHQCVVAVHHILHTLPPDIRPPGPVLGSPMLVQIKVVQDPFSFSVQNPCMEDLVEIPHEIVH